HGRVVSAIAAERNRAPDRERRRNEVGARAPRARALRDRTGLRRLTAGNRQKRASEAESGALERRRPRTSSAFSGGTASALGGPRAARAGRGMGATPFVAHTPLSFGDAPERA